MRTWNLYGATACTTVFRGHQDLLRESVRIARLACIGLMDQAGELLISHPMQVMDAMTRVDEKIVAALYGAMLAGVTPDELTSFAPRELVRSAALVAGLPRTSGEPGSHIDAIRADPLARAVMLVSLGNLVSPDRLAKYSPHVGTEFVSLSTEIIRKLTAQTD